MSQIIPLFPCPVVASSDPHRFTAKEKDFIATRQMSKNVGNENSTDNYVVDNHDMRRVKSFIEESLKTYSQETMRIKEGIELYITQSWINKTEPGGFHHKHKHPNSFVSGVLFCSENQDFKLPPIRFHRPDDLFPLTLNYEELNDFNGGSYDCQPVCGHLLLFPSSLEHEVKGNASDRDRVTLSFNTFVKGILGDAIKLTEVEI